MKRLKQVHRECVEALASELRASLVAGEFSGWIHQVPGDETGKGYRFQRLEELCAEHPLAQGTAAALTLASVPKEVSGMAVEWRPNDLERAASFALAWQVRSIGRRWGAPNDDAIFRKPTRAQVRAARRCPAPQDQQLEA